MTLTELVELLRSFFPRRLPKEYYERTIEVWTVGTIQSKDFFDSQLRWFIGSWMLFLFKLSPLKGWSLCSCCTCSICIHMEVWYWWIFYQWIFRSHWKAAAFFFCECYLCILKRQKSTILHGRFTRCGAVMDICTHLATIDLVFSCVLWINILPRTKFLTQLRQWVSRITLWKLRSIVQMRMTKTIRRNTQRLGTWRPTTE